jgi:hypothetical protein
MANQCVKVFLAAEAEGTKLSRDTHEATVRATDEEGNTGEDEFSCTVGASPSNNGSGGSYPS